MSFSFCRESLDKIYSLYNRREYVHPDPIEFLYNYPKIEDREIAGLIASSLAYGRVKQILKSVGKVLDIIGQSPRDYVFNRPEAYIRKDFIEFKHRFTTGDDITEMLIAIAEVIGEFGSLNQFFLSGHHENNDLILPALGNFIGGINLGNSNSSHLLPSPVKKSACKRPLLYLRWMIRHDDVDPGGWHGVSQSKLLLPLDTHMYKICRKFGLTDRKQANLKTVLEITKKFSEICPEDPVKYDFALSRFGIRDELDYDCIIN